VDGLGIVLLILLFGSALAVIGFVIVQSALFFRDFSRWYAGVWLAGEGPPSLPQYPTEPQNPFSPHPWADSEWQWRQILSRVPHPDPTIEADRSSARGHGARALLGAVVFALIVGLAFLVGPALD
jgi:hypothetical protein